MSEDGAINPSPVKPLGGGKKLNRGGDEDDNPSIPATTGKRLSCNGTTAIVDDDDESADNENQLLSSLQKTMHRNNEESQAAASETHESKDLTPHEGLIESLTNGVMDLDWFENHILYSKDDGLFYDRINAWIDRLNEIHQAASNDESLQTTKIPMEALSYIDNDSSVGCNPNVFSRLLLDRCKKSFTNTKFLAAGLDKLRAELEQS